MTDATRQATVAPDEESIVAALNGVRTEFPEKPFHQLFEEQAARNPDAIAVRAGDTSLCYGELNRRANQLAHLLRDRGVGPEVTVGLCLDRGVRMVVAVLGVLKAGGAYVPVDPRDPAVRRSAILDDAAVRVVVTDGPLDIVHDVVELDVGWSVLAGWPADDPAAAPAVMSHAAYLLYTSGSTGRPKGVVVEHRQLAGYTHAVIARFGIDRPLRFAMVQPLTVDSSVTALVPPLCTGGEVHLIPRERALDAEWLADWTRTHGVDCLKIAPSHLRALQSSPRFPELLPRRLLVVGGEASDWRWLRALADLAPGCQVFNHYGPTETTVGVLTLAVADHPDADWDTAPIGIPLPNTQAYVVDAAGRPAPFGVVGELVIGGTNVARGYHRREDLTAAAFVTDPLGRRCYRTGDYVRRLPDGTIAFLGRRDDQIKVRGFRVELGEIDAALRGHAAVRHAVTIVREDPPGDRRIVAYAEPHDVDSFDVAGLQSHLRARLAAHMIPQAVVVLERLPLSEHGKLDRAALPPPPATAVRPPTNELDRLVAAAWQEVLHTDAVGVRQNFFDIGGHSLLLVELQHRLRATTGREIELLDLFRHTTVRAQADFLAGREPVTSRPVRSGGAQANALLRRRQQQRRATGGAHE
jgi:amino acid adenylation domain-containing protein